MTKLSDIRREYAKEKLSEESVSHDPFKQFKHWMDEAIKAEIVDATAMSLGTATPDGKPSIRIVLLKAFDEGGFVFYTNYESRKGRELLAHPRAALCFYWAPLDIQVRIEGTVTKVADEEADAYFASRERRSQVGAWASRQSRPLESPTALDERFAMYEKEFEGRE